MKKTAIIGPAGAGKTTLAKNLSKELNIKVYHLDRLFWKSGWQSINGATRIDVMESVIRENQWIIEGMYIDSSVPRLNEADTIIFLDTNVFVCLWRVIKRHYREHAHSRRDIPMECTDKLNLRRIYKLLIFPIQDREKLKQKLSTYEDKQIIRLRSRKDLNTFLDHLVLNANEAVGSEKERGLVTAM
ncbi:MAG: AAA family ATPase [Ktedonobacteraceae bacterium]